MIRVEQWTGREAVMLQSVLRLSNRNFAQKLGVAFVTVMKWRRERESLTCQPDTQQLLDTALRELCTRDDQEAFALAYRAVHGPGIPTPRPTPTGSPEGG